MDILDVLYIKIYRLWSCNIILRADKMKLMLKLGTNLKHPADKIQPSLVKIVIQLCFLSSEF